jgi:hypothetical protein
MPSPSVTHTFANSTTADATQVNTNFTDIINGLTDGSKDLSISALTCAGNFTANGTTNTLGSASNDDLIINASLASSIPIKTTFSYDIGSATIGLRALYLGDSGSAARSVNLRGGVMASSYTFTFPTTGGTAGHVMKTAGSGTTSFVATYDKSLWSIGTVAKSADYTVLDDDGYYLILVTTSSTNRTITLPTAADNSGRRLVIKKVDTGTGSVTVDGESSETIDGLTSVQVAFKNDVIDIYCDGTEWHYVGQHYQSFNDVAPTITNAGTSPSAFCKGVRNGRQVTIWGSVTTGSAGTPTNPGMTTVVPANFRPNASVQGYVDFDGGTGTYYAASLNTSGTVAFFRLSSAGDVTTNWANSLTKQGSLTFVMY